MKYSMNIKALIDNGHPTATHQPGQECKHDHIDIARNDQIGQRHLPSVSPKFGHAAQGQPDTAAQLFILNLPQIQIRPIYLYRVFAHGNRLHGMARTRKAADPAQLRCLGEVGCKKQDRCHVRPHMTGVQAGSDILQ